MAVSCRATVEPLRTSRAEDRAIADHPLILVAGAGGFIGGHLVAALRRRGQQRVRAVDAKPLPEWWQRFPDTDNLVLDLRRPEACGAAARGAAVVYNLAADMGGMGFIEGNKALCMLNVLINTHLLVAARTHGVRKFFFVVVGLRYPADKQTRRRRRRPQGGGRLSGHARGRLRLGEALQRADVPAFPRGFRPRRSRSPGTTTSTAPMAPGLAGGRRRLPPSAAR